MRTILCLVLLLSIARADPLPTRKSAGAAMPPGANAGSYLRAADVNGILDALTGVSVKNYGAKGDGTTDDTAAVQAAIDAARGAITTMNTGVMIATGPAVVFPAGRYKINGTLTTSGYLRLVAPDYAILDQANAAATTLSVTTAYLVEVRGVTFANGATALHFENANLDTTMITVERSEFHAQRSWAITVTPTAPAAHLSAYVQVRRCRFVNTALGVKSYADQTDVAETWASWGGPYAASNTAFFETRGGDWSGGNLVLDRFFGVPTLSDKTQVRWIDNYGSVDVRRSRFGGENGGIPVVYNYAPYNNAYPYTGAVVAVRSSDVWAGTGRSDAGVVVLKTHVPGMIVIEGNRGPMDVPLISNGGIADLSAYVAAASQPTKSFRFHIGPMLPGSMADPTPQGPLYPAALKPYLSDTRPAR